MARKRKASPGPAPSPAKRRELGILTNPTPSWNGIVSRPISGTTKQDLDAELFTPVPTEMNEARNIIGNMEGRQIFTECLDLRDLVQKTRSEMSELRMSFEDRLDNQQKSLENQQKSLDNQQKSLENQQKSFQKMQCAFDRMQAIACERRGYALDEWCDIEQSPLARVARNASVHGGDIIQDITTISNEEKSNRCHALLWKDTFENVYGVDHPTCKRLEASLESNSRLEWILNTHANITVLHNWIKRDRDTKERIATICREIIDKWRSHPDGVLRWEPSALNRYNNIVDLYYG